MSHYDFEQNMCSANFSPSPNIHYTIFYEIETLGTKIWDPEYDVCYMHIFPTDLLPIEHNYHEIEYLGTEILDPK